MYSHFT